MALKNCPSCGHDSVFVPLVPAVGYDGTLFGGKSEGFCNSPRCDQLLWYYPRSGRVTRRTVGMTLKEYTSQRVRNVTDLHCINIRRKNAGLRPLIEQPVAIMVLPDEVDPETFKIEYADLTEAIDWYERAVDKIAGWYYWLLAAIKSPFQKDEDDG